MLNEAAVMPRFINTAQSRSPDLSFCFKQPEGWEVVPSQSAWEFHIQDDLQALGWQHELDRSACSPASTAGNISMEIEQLELDHRWEPPGEVHIDHRVSFPSSNVKVYGDPMFARQMPSQLASSQPAEALAKPQPDDHSGRPPSPIIPLPAPIPAKKSRFRCDVLMMALMPQFISDVG